MGNAKPSRGCGCGSGARRPWLSDKEASTQPVDTPPETVVPPYLASPCRQLQRRRRHRNTQHPGAELPPRLCQQSAPTTTTISHALQVPSNSTYRPPTIPSQLDKMDDSELSPKFAPFIGMVRRCASLFLCPGRGRDIWPSQRLSPLPHLQCAWLTCLSLFCRPALHRP